jgi:hypothetical protein
MSPPMKQTFNTERKPLQSPWTHESMPFIFICSQCRSILYEDPSPLLQNGSYKSPTYFENVLTRLGDKCHQCGHELALTPSKIEVFALRSEDNISKKKQETEGKMRTLKNDHLRLDGVQIQISHKRDRTKIYCRRKQ